MNREIISNRGPPPPEIIAYHKILFLIFRNEQKSDIRCQEINTSWNIYTLWFLIDLFEFLRYCYKSCFSSLFLKNFYFQSWVRIKFYHMRLVILQQEINIVLISLMQWRNTSFFLNLYWKWISLTLSEH